jgi:hypothetical protein
MRTITIIDKLYDEHYSGQEIYQYCFIFKVPLDVALHGELKICNDVETAFVKFFNDIICQKNNDLMFKLWEVMKKAGYEVTRAKRESSIAWYIMCRTEKKLESLRRLYESPFRLLERILQCIFNHVCGSGDSQRLCVTWATEDY